MEQEKKKKEELLKELKKKKEENEQEIRRLAEELPELEEQKEELQHAGQQKIRVKTQEPETSQETASSLLEGITDEETISFLSSCKYAEQFTEKQEAEMVERGFLKTKTDNPLLKALLKRVVGAEKHPLFYIKPHRGTPEHDLAVWLLILLMSEHARDIVSRPDQGYDVSFRHPADPSLRYAVEVSLNSTQEQAVEAMKKLAWAKDYMIFCPEENQKNWKGIVGDHSKIIGEQQLESLEDQPFEVFLERLQGFSALEAKALD